jgi:signal transduction histidine kinase
MILLDNAVKYSHSGGAVVIRLAVADQMYRIEVEDHGPGIGLESQPRIFDRFYRADPARSRAAGTSGGAGLGLSIARWVAEAHQGRLNLISSSAAGTVFRAEIPVNCEQ